MLNSKRISWKKNGNLHRTGESRGQKCKNEIEDFGLLPVSIQFEYLFFEGQHHSNKPL